MILLCVHVSLLVEINVTGLQETVGYRVSLDRAWICRDSESFIAQGKGWWNNVSRRKHCQRIIVADILSCSRCTPRGRLQAALVNCTADKEMCGGKT